MSTYRWTGTHAHRDHREGRVIEPGDTFDAERIAAAHPHDCEPVADDEAAGEGEDVDAEPTEIADPPLNPADFAVDELRSALGDGGYDGSELDAIEAAERAGQERTTALDAIDAAR